MPSNTTLNDNYNKKQLNTTTIPADGQQQRVLSTHAQNIVNNNDITSKIHPYMLSDLLLQKGPLAIRFITNGLDKDVPGFKKLSASKQRRVIMSLLENGDELNSVVFEKIGWGQWRARKVEDPKDFKKELASVLAANEKINNDLKTQQQLSHSFENGLQERKNFIKQNNSHITANKLNNNSYFDENVLASSSSSTSSSSPPSDNENNDNNDVFFEDDEEEDYFHSMDKNRRKSSVLLSERPSPPTANSTNNATISKIVKITHRRKSSTRRNSSNKNDFLFNNNNNNNNNSNNNGNSHSATSSNNAINIIQDNNVTETNSIINTTKNKSKNNNNGKNKDFGDENMPRISNTESCVRTTVSLATPASNNDKLYQEQQHSDTDDEDWASIGPEKLRILKKNCRFMDNNGGTGTAIGNDAANIDETTNAAFLLMKLKSEQK
ncbi:Stb3p SCDLUD_001805 [Saccharomycodes ludwigii]|uniref:Stb3p n=1 Tax=Saccharomycodes ludwigii TaxID=36035 RepID=UPI001E845B5D|nr:hypothetical protein SCDLUD_001805 [Saccharomycodes ludwigii]KAH3902017.1 hypothetical protein SCDLUD_001805 [Saccharomycodes ludwigii]